MSNGSPAVDSGSGCECCGTITPGTPCANCGSDTTPAQYTASFASVELETANRQSDDGLINGEFTTGTTFSGTFTLSQTAACIWEYNQPYSAQIMTGYTGPGGTGDAVPSDRISILLQKLSGSDASIYVQFSQSDGDDPWDEGTVIVFARNALGSGSNMSPFVCDEGGNFSNGHSAFANTTFFGGGLTMGRNGSVTITPV